MTTRSWFIHFFVLFYYFVLILQITITNQEADSGCEERSEVMKEECHRLARSTKHKKNYDISINEILLKCNNRDIILAEEDYCRLEFYGLLPFQVSTAINTRLIGEIHFWEHSWLLSQVIFKMTEIAFQIRAVRLLGFYFVVCYSLSVIIDSQFLLFQCPVISSFRLEVVSGSVVHLEPQLQPDTLR